MPSAAATRRFADAREGSVFVEFALLFPIFVAVLLGVVDFASASNRHLQLDGAVGIGAQLAVARQPTTGSLGEIETAVLAAVPAAGRSTTLAVEVSRFCERLDGSPVDCSLSGQRAIYVSIRLTEAWSLFAPYPAIGDSVTLAAASTVRIQ